MTPSIAGFQSHDTFSAWWSTPNENAVVGPNYLFIIWLLILVLVAHIYNLTKFGRFHKAQSGNMCKVDHQTLSCIKVLK